MAQALSDYQQLINQIQFLLFEIGIGLSSNKVEHFAINAHRDSLFRLKQASEQENMLSSTIYSHHIDDYCYQLKQQWQKTKPYTRFYPWTQLQTELSESIANQTLALAYRYQWDKSLCKQCQDFKSLWSWLKSLMKPAQQLSFLEQWGSQGHPYHPNFKAKIGLSRREVLQYSPEFQARVNIYWLAIHRGIVSTANTGQCYYNLLQQHYPDIMHNWQELLKHAKVNPDDYLPIPVHPWQFRNKIQLNLVSLIDEKLLIPLRYAQSTKPSMSFRTMIPASGPHITLPVAVQTTGALRTVSRGFIHSVSALSKCLHQILTTNRHFNNRCYVAYDLSGIHLNHRRFNSHHLAAIIRQDPIDYVSDKQILVPLASLLCHSAITNQPLIVEIINEQSLSPQQFFSNYVTLIVSSQLPLYLKYGIALEAHQQNTLIVFEHNQALKMIIRDLGDIRIHPRQLSNQGINLNLQPGSVIACHCFAEIRNQFIHANLISNFEPLINCLHQYYQLNKLDLWANVRQQLLYQFNQLKNVIEPSLYKQEYHALFEQPWQHRCLLRMRLEPCHDYILTQRSNPFMQLQQNLSKQQP